VIPSPYYIIAADDGIRLLAQHGRMLYVDGTFDLVEARLTLTTILVKVGQIGVPVAWLLARSQQQEYYTYFFRFVRDLVTQITHRTLHVLAVFADFEEGLRNAAAEAFPGVKVFGESFHFMQANIRWMAQHVGKEHLEELIPNLRQLMASPELNDSLPQVKMFLVYWMQRCPAYAEYFRSMWCLRWPPRVWAAFGRKGLHDLPTGDHILEGWHNSLQHHTWPNHQEAIDHAIPYLWEEWDQHHRRLASSSHVAALEKEKESNAQKWRKWADTLAVHPPPIAQITTPTSPVPPLSVDDLSSMDMALRDEGEVQSMSPAPAKPAMAQPLPAAGMCSACGKTKANLQCTLLACLNCCTKDPTTNCRVMKHQTGKPAISGHPLLDELEKQFALPADERAALYIKYMGGSNPGTVRAVTPTRWAAQRSSFFGVGDADRTELLSGGTCSGFQLRGVRAAPTHPATGPMRGNRATRRSTSFFSFKIKLLKMTLDRFFFSTETTAYW